MSYSDFLETKRKLVMPVGLTDIPPLNPQLFDFQRVIVEWALRRGRAAIFADCGLGKTFMQLEWAKHIPGHVLIVQPLAVTQQTIREAERFGITAQFCRRAEDCRERIIVTNYQQLHNFNADVFQAVVLDESGILKSMDGKTMLELMDMFKRTPYKLCCSATPAPNDFMELGNHAEFLAVATASEMLSEFFVHDGSEVQKWRLKGHAIEPFWQWLASWSICIRKPSDLGFDNGAFDLPPLEIKESTVKAQGALDGYLFPMMASTLEERRNARKTTIKERAQRAADLVNASDEPWLIWCNLNNEADTVQKLIPGAVQIAGADDNDVKADRIMEFIDGQSRVLISKPSICGWGVNLQHCSNIIFLGLSDSYEQFYQSIRRCWRFGQTKPVTAHVITADIEGAVVKNIMRKEADAAKMHDGMVKHMATYTKAQLEENKRMLSDEYQESEIRGDKYNLYRGDCVEVVKYFPDDSIDFSIFSPPFSSLYTYSNSIRDMGNCSHDEEFMEHFGFLVAELFRVIKPGRLCSFHCMNLPTNKTHDGYIGIRDFRGELIRLFESKGWIYHSEVCIWKDPVTAMQRTKALGLLHKQLKKDSCMSRQGIPDYLVTMRKPGENTSRVEHTNESFPVAEWQQLASPIWTDINPSDTLQFRSAREHQDEKHICPLQLKVIERALRLWSNPGDLVLSPFMGIGSEGFVSLRMGRKFAGIELKESYFRQAVKNIQAATQDDLFSRITTNEEAELAI